MVSVEMKEHVSPFRTSVLTLVLLLISACSEASPTDDTATTSQVPTTVTTTTAVETDEAPPYVHPGAEELTDRQAEMLEVLDRYTAAWQVRDGDLAASYMTEYAVFEYFEQGETYSVADGSLQARISAGPYDTMRLFVPQMVYGNRIVLTGTVDAVGVKWLSVIRFTTVGDKVLIDKETLFYGP